jgi:hypothetical protein
LFTRAGGGGRHSHDQDHASRAAALIGLAELRRGRREMSTNEDITSGENGRK